MQPRMFRIKILFSVVIFLFASSFPMQAFNLQEISEQNKIQELIREGKELYENGEYKEAIVMFLRILAQAKSVDELTEVYFNLSLIYFADAQSQKSNEYLQKLFEIRPDKTIDERYFPQGFVELFNRLRLEPQTKPESKVKSKPKNKLESKIKAEPEKKRGEQKDTPQPVKEGDLIPLGLVDIPPLAIRKVSPEYPIAARRDKIEGTVIVNALISERGDVISTAILMGIKGSFGLNESAQRAAKKWKFKPALKDNKAVKVWKPMVFKFTEKKSQ